MSNVKIRGIDIYHPKKKVNKQYYINHYKQKEQDVTKLLEEVLGREDKYIIDNHRENALSMAIQSSKAVLEKENIEGQDLDMIYFATQTPETLFPSNALQLHQAIGGGRHTLAMDINVNCAGMLVAIEQAARAMLANPSAERSLVVGSDYLTLIADPDDVITYGNFGDASCAVILEKTEEDTGFIDAMYEVDTTDVRSLTFPVDGVSTFLNSEHPYKYVKEVSKPRDTMPETFDLFERLLKHHHMDITDVDVICPSQFVLANVERIKDNYSLRDDQVLFVGDKYGYTAASSPLLALYEGIKAGKVTRGDTILFYTIGTGHLIIAMLFKY